MYFTILMCMAAILKANDAQKERLPIEEECNKNHSKGGDIEINYNNF